MAQNICTASKEILHEDGVLDFGRIRRFSSDKQTIDLSKERWESFGEPTEITVTIEPGNHMDRPMTLTEDGG